MTYGYEVSGVFKLLLDDSKYINHSIENSCFYYTYDEKNKAKGYASKDINIGDEIEDDYTLLDELPWVQ